MLGRKKWRKQQEQRLIDDETQEKARKHSAYSPYEM